MLTNGAFANGCLFLVVRPRRLSVTEWPAAPAAPEEATQRQVACWMKIMSARHAEKTADNKRNHHMGHVQFQQDTHNTRDLGQLPR